jgi:alanyl-tRNA synthetase
MTSNEVRKKFLTFFEKRGHTVIPSASLVPENDPSVLFNTAGMQPLVPYLLGEKHPAGTRLASCQKCVRTGDIDEVGNHKNLTFFEMLGNWSLGDYFKEDAIKWSFELLTSKTEGFGLDPELLYVTVFEGDENAPRDLDAVNIWKKYIPENRIYFLPAKNNWWSPGDNGPCGPDSEMFYDVTPKGLGDMTHEQYVSADEKGEVIEIWNDVFMEFLKKDGKVVGKLDKKNVDTGSGLERVTMIMQGKSNVYETDFFSSLMAEIKKNHVKDNERASRIVADHIRTAIFMISDGVVPSNTDRGYILRRLIRRAVFNTDAKKLNAEAIDKFVEIVAEIYEDSYESIVLQRAGIKDELVKESERFAKTIEQGMKEFEKLAKSSISGFDAFTLFSSYGFPIDLTIELAKQRSISVDVKEFQEEFKKHQDLSRSGAEGKFKGGLGDTSEMSLKYHTTTHLLHQALRTVLGTHVSQKGSNITPERLRFDFTHTGKMTDEEKKKVEEIVNAQITKKLPVHRVELPKAEAEKTGALHFFGDKYGDIVSVYYIGDSMDSAYSKEFCGGPHVENIGTLGTFKIQKEEAVSAGVRRIKAVLI